MKLLIQLLRHPKFWMGFGSMLAVGSIVIFALSRMKADPTGVLFGLQMVLMFSSSIALLLSERRHKQIRPTNACTRQVLK